MSASELSGNLHFKPLCAQIERTILWGLTTIHKNCDSTRWQGRVVIIISKVMLSISSLLTVPIALIDAIASFALAGGLC